jgi:hypothetical protein
LVERYIDSLLYRHAYLNVGVSILIYLLVSYRQLISS